MHTSSGVDAIDEYLETIIKKDGRFYYKYGKEERPVTVSEISIPYRTGEGMGVKKFTVYRTHHGPIVREAAGKWVSTRMLREPVKALMQSYLRTKAKDYQAYRETMELKANSSNNTIFADSKGEIAYFHGNFIPRRDTKFDWTKPVDGSDPATEWQGLLSIDETPHLLNPKSGWLYNCNNSPWSAAGQSSPKKQDYPAYVESGVESARGLHAVRVLEKKTDFTLDSLIAAAYDNYLPWFDKPLPALIQAWDKAPSDNANKQRVADQIALLRTWDHRWSVASIPTTLAIYWAEDMYRSVGEAAQQSGILIEDYIAERASPDVLLQSLATASARLTAEFSGWKVPWGDINRYQHLNGSIIQRFNDAAPSLPVGFTSSIWGSLASFGARTFPGTRKRYGINGNSFVAVVEFGDKIRAKAVATGGESGHEQSRHFNDQAERYTKGDLRDVYFYRSQLQGHSEREYHPGE
jgi:acyl-homoserine-lactone acylase